MEDKASGQDKDDDAQKKRAARPKGDDDEAEEEKEEEEVVLHGIKHPGENDVMFGRGGDTNYHIGNHRFRTEADGFCKRYHEASRKEKALVVKELVDTWRGRKPPGRFLTRTNPEKGEESDWHDAGNAVALKKAAKILSERSKAYRTGPSPLKRKAPPSGDEPRILEAHGTQQTLEALPQQRQSTATLQQGGATLQQQPLQQQNFGQMMGYQAGYPTASTQATGFAAGFQGQAQHPRQAYPTGSPLVGVVGVLLEGQRVILQQGPAQQQNPTQQNMGSVASIASVSAAAAAPLPGDTDETGNPGGGERAPNQGEAGDDSPDSIAQDSSAGGREDLPSAASLAGVFTSSSTSSQGKGSSPSTDES